jgi:hypothetical protein
MAEVVGQQDLDARHVRCGGQNAGDEDVAGELESGDGNGVLPDVRHPSR